MKGLQQALNRPAGKEEWYHLNFASDNNQKDDTI